MIQPSLYRDPIVIKYNDGHRFPKDLSTKDFAPLKNFLDEKFNEKL
jgi:hypothetical protein